MRMLAGVCMVLVVLVCVLVVSCAFDGAWTGRRGPASGGRWLGGVLRLVEQDFEEVGLVCWG